MPTRALVTRYEQDLQLFPDRWHKIGLVVLAIVIIGFPMLADARWMTVANLSLVSVVGALGLMILTGFAGQISLGHAAFLAVGAYTVAILGEQLQWPFWLCIPTAGVTAAAVGLTVGPFALRLKGLYLAIVTLGMLFLVNHILLSVPSLTHGVSGIAVPMRTWFGSGGALGDFHDSLVLGPVELDSNAKLYFLFVTIAVVATWATKNLARSNTGRALVAVRDHDLAASVLGVSPARAKITAFGVSSFYAGIAGAMFAYQQQYITVSPPFDLDMSVTYIAMIVLGGIGTTFGAVAGALAMGFLGPLAETIGHELPYISQLSSAQQSTLLFAVLVCAILVVEPLGILGIWLRIKRYFAAWPFRY